MTWQVFMHENGRFGVWAEDRSGMVLADRFLTGAASFVVDRERRAQQLANGIRNVHAWIEAGDVRVDLDGSPTKLERPEACVHEVRYRPRVGAFTVGLDVVRRARRAYGEHGVVWIEEES